MSEYYMYVQTITLIIKWVMNSTLSVFAIILLNQMIKFVRLKNEAMSKALETKDTSGETQD